MKECKKGKFQSLYSHIHTFLNSFKTISISYFILEIPGHFLAIFGHKVIQIGHDLNHLGHDVIHLGHVWLHLGHSKSPTNPLFRSKSKKTMKKSVKIRAYPWLFYGQNLLFLYGSQWLAVARCGAQVAHSGAPMAHTGAHLAHSGAPWRTKNPSKPRFQPKIAENRHFYFFLSKLHFLIRIKNVNL